MAKLVGPCLSLESHGQLGKSVVFNNRNGRNICKAFSTPNKSKSYTQQVRQALYKIYVAEWQGMSAEDKAEFSTRADEQGRVSGFHQFLHERLLNGLPFTYTQRTDSTENNQWPVILSDSSLTGKVYCMYTRDDGGGYDQIYLSSFNQDGSGWKETKLTSDNYNKYYPHFCIDGDIIYLTYTQLMGTGKRELWTGQVQKGGSGFSSTQRTTNNYDTYDPRIAQYGQYLHLCYRRYDATNKFNLYTARVKKDGSGWEATKRTTSLYGMYNNEMCLSGGYLYYVWADYDGAIKRQIWTGRMSVDYTGWISGERTTSAYNKYSFGVLVVGSVVYYCIVTDENSTHPQVWLGTSNLDLSGFSASQKSDTPYSKAYGCFAYAGGRLRFGFIERITPSDSRVNLGSLNLDGSGWKVSCYGPTGVRLYSLNISTGPLFLHFIWQYRATYRQIVTARLGMV